MVVDVRAELAGGGHFFRVEQPHDARVRPKPRKHIVEDKFVAAGSAGGESASFQPSAGVLRLGLALRQICQVETRASAYARLPGSLPEEHEDQRDERQQRLRRTPASPSSADAAKAVAAASQAAATHPPPFPRDDHEAPDPCAAP